MPTTYSACKTSSSLIEHFENALQWDVPVITLPTGLPMPAERFASKDLINIYEVCERQNGLLVLSASCPNEWACIQTVLLDLRCRRRVTLLEMLEREHSGMLGERYELIKACSFQSHLELCAFEYRANGAPWKNQADSSYKPIWTTYANNSAFAAER